MNITQVDYAILGLLAQAELSGYQVRMVFEKTALGNFSSSPGAIYPALARLHKNKLITTKKSKKRRVDLLAISKNGLNALQDWVHKPVVRNDIKKGLEILVLRIAFLDCAENKKKRVTFFASMILALKENIAELESHYKKESGTMPLGGRLTFEYGLESYKHTLKWLLKVKRAYNSQ